MNVKSLITVFAALLLISQTAKASPFPHESGEHYKSVSEVNSVFRAVSSFYSIYGHWPESWGNVRDAGLFQRPVKWDGVHVIDLDDQGIDEDWDIVYVYRGAQTPPGFLSLGLQSDSNPLIPFEARDTSSTWDGFIVGSSGNVWGGDIVKGNRELQQLLGLACVCKEAIRGYDLVYGHCPSTWQEFVSSGLAPFGSNPVNPYTGGPLLCDGSAFQLKYQYYPEDNSFILQVMGPDGKRVWGGTCL